MTKTNRLGMSERYHPYRRLESSPLLQQVIAAISQKNTVEIYTELSRPGAEPLLAATVLGLLKTACEQKAPLDIKIALLEASGFASAATLGTEGPKALDLAIQHNDLELAEYLLDKDVEPPQNFPHRLEESMQNMLTFRRRRKLLYPALASASPQVQAQYSELDKAAWEGRWDDAEDILKQDEIGCIEDIPTAWGSAVEAGRLDILRTFLLLGIVDGNRYFRVQEPKRIEDPGIREVMKEFPYFSPKRKVVWNFEEKEIEDIVCQHFNGKATFPGTDEESVECRHLAMYRQNLQAENPKIKVDDALFMNLEAISKVPPETHEQYYQLQARATETHLIRNDDFGRFLSEQFAAMDKGPMEDGKPKTKLMLIQSMDHGMSLGLMIKLKEGKKSYVVKFYDPNETTQDTRSRKKAPVHFEFDKLSDYLDGDVFEDCYPQPNGVSMVYVRPDDLDLDLALQGNAMGTPDRKLTSCVPEVDSEMMFHILKGGFAGNVRQLKDAISSMTQMNRNALFAKKTESGASGIYLAFQHGHADTIRALAEVLAEIDTDKLEELVMSKDRCGIPSLQRAFEEGHADTIKVMAEVLPLIWRNKGVDREKWVDFLMVTDSDGTPGLRTAFTHGHPATIKAMAEVLPLTPANEQLPLLKDADRVTLLEAKGASLYSGLYAALKEGHAGVITAFGSLLDQVGDKARVKLLAAKHDAGTLALAVAVKDKKWDAVKAYLEVLASHASELGDDEKRTMLDYLNDGMTVNGVADAFNTAPEAVRQKMVEVHAKLAPPPP